MAEYQLHRVGMAGLRAPVHQLQLQWTPTTYNFVQRFRHSDSADGRAEHAHHQHRRVAGATAAIPGGVEGLLLLGWV